ncbi:MULTISPECIES: WYL domain-containing protein [unclassified Polaromonas]|uniref:WYL domain-containing protein n=1 Tax=unclassified Polaromonas TaxID=2638319 RepID=UPI000F07BFAA|nr:MULTISPECIES: WYL domain-containing protein [unclassified Polaromonas]AYQ27482.1 WYL domain-containing protein [Polaromonas sp. SP1]QGJ17677.1 WYL domain-containing protein [Polaromonas sp. Pch-P]
MIGTDVAWLDDLSFAQKQRLQFIEARLIWDGSVRRGQVCEVFDVTPNHLSRDFRRYRHHHAHSLEYDVEKKAYTRGRDFKPLLASGSAEEYLSLLQAYSTSKSTAVVPALGQVTAAESIMQPTGSIDPEVLRLIMLALREESGLALTYQSLNEPNPVPRTLWPHTLVFNGDRWHARAFDGRHNEFRDFVLARCSQAKLDPVVAPLAASEDKEWHEAETVDVIPAARLSANQKSVVAREFGMKATGDGEFVWSSSIRKCLVRYFLVRHRLEGGGSTTKQVPGQHPYLALKDPQLAIAYRFGGD